MLAGVGLGFARHESSVFWHLSSMVVLFLVVTQEERGQGAIVASEYAVLGWGSVYFLPLTS